MKIYHQGQLDFFCAIYAVINAINITHGISVQDGRHILAACINELAEYKKILEALTGNATDHHWIVGYLLGRFCRSGRFAFKAAKLPLKPMPVAAPANSKLDQPDGNATAGTALNFFLGQSSRTTNQTDAPSGTKNLAAWLRVGWPEKISLDEISELEMWADIQSFSDSAGGRGISAQDLDAPAKPRWRTEDLWPLLQCWLPSRGLFGALGADKQLQDRCILLRFHRFLPQTAEPLISHWSTGRDFHKDTLNLADCTASNQAVHALPLKQCVMDFRDLGGERLLGIEPESVWFLEKA